MKFLFICSANKQRSKTAEDYFSESFPGVHCESAGTNRKICEQEGTNPVTEELLEWADVIFAMENHHVRTINQMTEKRFRSKIVVLSVPDRYKYFQKELIALLEEKLADYLPN